MALNKTSKFFSFTLYHYPGKFDHVEKINYSICRLLAVQKPQIYFQTENRYLGVKPLIHQSELGTYSKVVPFQEKKFLSLCSIVKTTEWNGLIKIDN